MRNIEHWLRQKILMILPCSKDLLKVLYRIGNQSLVIFILVMILIVPMMWFLTYPISTHIQIDVSTNKFSFLVAEFENEFIELKGVKFQSAIIKNFDRIQFSQNDTPIEIASDENPIESRVTIETTSPNIEQFGILNELVLTPDSKVTLNMTEGENDNRELMIFIEKSKKIEKLIAKFEHFGTFNLQSPAQSFSAIDLSSDFIEITGQPQGLKLILTIANDKNFDILPTSIKVTAPDFTIRDMVRGKLILRSGFIARKEDYSGKISYSEYPQINPIEFYDSNFLILGKKDNFKIEHILFDSETKGFNVRLSGLAQDKIAIHPTGLPDKSRDYRLTRFEMISEKSKFGKMLLEIIIWLIPAILGIVGIVITPQDEQSSL